MPSIGSASAEAIPATPILMLRLVACLLGMAMVSSVQAEEAIDFSSQVRPILSDKCFHCHGPDAQNQDSELRLDTQEDLFADLGGYAAVVAGDLEASELHARIHSTDESDQMPPPESNRSLTDEQRRILDRWIEQGAPYEAHWSFISPERTPPPTDALATAGWDTEVVEAWSRNPIDAFIAQGLIENDLKPSPQADLGTLMRRASLTLTGLLPPESLRGSVTHAATDSAYEEAVDQLLDTDAYAERQSVRWLDAARYADTDGYQNDYARTNWPWRDWVTMAFRDNMPFDQFTIEQLAGDMLSEATDSQRLASAFNRNHRQNAEGGALAAEFAVENAIDRVETTSTVWLGLTMGCARCHDHKYDPLSQREFYQFYGYFNNIGEKGIGKGVDANPTMKTISPLVEIDPEWLGAVESAESNLADAEKSLPDRLEAWVGEQRQLLAEVEEQSKPEAEWAPAEINGATVQGRGELELVDKATAVYTGDGHGPVGYRVALKNADQQNVRSLRLEALADDRFDRPTRMSPSSNGNFVLTDVKVRRNGKPIAAQAARASYEQPGFPAVATTDGDKKSGWAVSKSPTPNESVRLDLLLAETLTLAAGDTLELVLRFDSQYPQHTIGKFRVHWSPQPVAGPPNLGLAPAVVAAIRKSADERNDEEKKALKTYHEGVDDQLAAAKAAFKKAERELKLQGAERATVMVMSEREGKPAEFYLLDRGQYDQPVKSDPLTRGVPEALLSEEVPQPGDRLALANWLVSAENPLTARVLVNRIWQDHFGVGLVKTADDFGLQGEVPSHPELLDWLAVEFVESGWDVKALHRLIVSSAAYRQASRTNEALVAQDPENRLLARGPRYRADGFVIRDMALQASRLLNPQVGGPSVKPYQPKGLWEVVAANAGTRYTPSKGSDLYRKSMYSYWKRAVNPPRQTIFDAGGREICNVRVRRTNTPLQALVLLNDPTFIESARKLSEEALEASEASDEERLATMYRLAIAREIKTPTLEVLKGSLEYFRGHYGALPAAAEKLIATGDSPRDESLDPIEHAAMTAVAHVILNLDEFVTIE